MPIVVLFLVVAALISFIIGFFRWDVNMPVNATAGGLAFLTLAGLIQFWP